MTFHSILMAFDGFPTSQGWRVEGDSITAVYQGGALPAASGMLQQACGARVVQVIAVSGWAVEAAVDQLLAISCNVCWPLAAAPFLRKDQKENELIREVPPDHGNTARRSKKECFASRLSLTSCLLLFRTIVFCFMAIRWVVLTATFLFCVSFGTCEPKFCIIHRGSCLIFVNLRASFARGGLEQAGLWISCSAYLCCLMKAKHCEHLWPFHDCAEHARGLGPSHRGERTSGPTTFIRCVLCQGGAGQP